MSQDMFSQDTRSLTSQSDNFESEIDEAETTFETEESLIKDPYALDPCFESEEAMAEYLRGIGYVEVVKTRDDVQIELDEVEGTLRQCNCSECSEISDIDGFKYLCCNQRFPEWKILLSEDVESVSCITHCKVMVQFKLKMSLTSILFVKS